MLQSLGVSPGDNILLLNDIILSEEQVDIYQYVRASFPDVDLPLPLFQHGRPCTLRAPTTGDITSSVNRSTIFQQDSLHPCPLSLL